MAAFTDSLIPRRTTSDYWFSNIRPGVAALLLGGAFGAGVYLGNADPTDTPSLELAGSDAWIARVDARSEKLADVRSELQLRYHDELVGPPRDARDRRRAHHVAQPTPAVIASLEKEENHQAAKSLRERLQAVATAVRSDGTGLDAQPPVSTTASRASNPLSEPNAATSDASAPAEMPSGTGSGERPPAPAESKALADQISLPERVEDEEHVRVDDAAEDIEAIEEPREKSQQDSRRIEDALARVLGNANAASQGAAPESPHRFYVQVAATPSLDGAQKLVDGLRQAGFAALVLQGEGKDLQAVYRIRVGPLPDRDTATARANQLKSKTGMSGFVIRD